MGTGSCGAWRGQAGLGFARETRKQEPCDNSSSPVPILAGSSPDI